VEFGTVNIISTYYFKYVMSTQWFIYGTPFWLYSIWESRFNGVKFLQEMRDKTIMFVGDSLGRNQWESLICMISSSAPSINTHIIHEDPLSTFKILVSSQNKFSIVGKWNFFSVWSSFLE